MNNLLSNLVAILLLLGLLILLKRMFATKDRRGSFPRTQPGFGRNMAAWTRPGFLGVDRYAHEASSFVVSEELRYRAPEDTDPVLNVASWVPVTLLSIVALAIGAAASMVAVHPALAALLLPVLLALGVMFLSPSDL